MDELDLEQEIPKEGEAPIEDMSPEEAKASLGFSTMLSEQMMPQEAEAIEGGEEEQAAEDVDGDMDSKIEQKVQEALSPILSRLEEILGEDINDEPQEEETT